MVGESEGEAMTTLSEKLAQMPPERQARIRTRTDELALEEATLRAARKKAKLTQVGMAKRLGVGQDSVSRLETRKDMLVSTLRNYVAAMGGKVRVVVELQGQPAVELKKLGSVRARVAQRKKRAAKNGKGRMVA
jgi:DNA-binding XRE family transcriptional regulator